MGTLSLVGEIQPGRLGAGAGASVLGGCYEVNVGVGGGG